jgi:hypothetical protein
MDRTGFAVHIIHEQVLSEIVGRGEVGFATAQFGDFLDKVHQPEIAGQHKRID